MENIGLYSTLDEKRKAMFIFYQIKTTLWSYIRYRLYIVIWLSVVICVGFTQFLNASKFFNWKFVYDIVSSALCKVCF